MNSTILESFAVHPLVMSIGWTLIHFIWQAAFIGLAVALVLAAMHNSAARLRYLVACIGLGAMALAPLVTLTYRTAISDNYGWQVDALAKQSTSNILESKILPDRDADLPQQFPNTSVEPFKADTTRPSARNTVDDVAMVSTGSWQSTLETVERTMGQWLPWCVAIWMAGVLCLAIRMLVGLRRVGRWRRECVDVVGGELAGTISRLSKRMNLRQSVRLLKTAREAVPAVIGWIRPTILVPASMLSGLTAAELESILAHELAHVRRYDYLVNLMQTVVETLLFYHPAVWWLSHRIRAERENCCDDIAVEVCGNRIVFARALSRMEELRCSHERLSLAASGGSLLVRIRRIVGPEPAATGSWWPAGAIVLGSMGLLLGGLWMSALNAASAKPTGSELSTNHASNATVPDVAPENEIIQTRKQEALLIDPKTGLEQRVFAGIKLWASGENGMRDATLAMKYTNVMVYSFIPASVAKQLGAVELGEIDFGSEPPPQSQPYQVMLNPNIDLSQLATIPESKPNNLETVKTVHVDELTQPVGPETRITPYSDDAVWIPGHLGFYGLNPTNQHRFKIVRLDKVALGVGPEFGPVNALVLDDKNSDFGLLGMDWIRQVRGSNGEGLWFVAAEGALYFMAGKVDSTETSASQAPGDAVQGSVTVKSTGHEPVPARLDVPGVKVLASFTYPQDTRTSTGWVEVDGVQLPIDVGLEYDGIKVYQSLMQDVVAVDSKTGKSIWKMDWTKTMPMWQTLSIVELDRDGKQELAVELYAASKKTGELDYEYLSLKTGEKIEPPAIPASDSGQQSDAKSDGDLQIKIKAVERDRDRVTRAVIDAFKQGRSATELIRHFAVTMPDEQRFMNSSTTNMETIVSASQANYLPENRMDAAKVLFNLPEGSGLRAEFSGTNVEISPGDKSMTVIVTDGRIELIDAGGVIRASASPEDKAAELVIECHEELGEVAMALITRRKNKSSEAPNPPVQVVMNTDTGAPKDEGDPPHGAIRYEIQKGEDGGQPILRMKMKWRYEMKRLLEEAQAESGLSAEELIYGKQDDTPTSIPILLPSVRKPENSQKAADDETPWGELAQQSGLRSRLTLLSEAPVIGKPLLFKLEVKNFGDKQTGVDAQYYEPFRVLRAIQPDGKSAKFIGMTPQTSGSEQQLRPGASLTLWENMDANGLFLLHDGNYKFFAEADKWATQTMRRNSNTLAVEIAAGKQTTLHQLLEELGDGLPETWKVSSGMAQADGWNGIFLSYVPTNLKRDAKTIQIWFTDEKLADDYELGKGDRKQVVTQLGKCEFGFMNVAAPPDAIEIWPNYLEHIRKAAKQTLTFEQKSDAGQTPWSVAGKVTDGDGKPVKGATVRAHCGIGTLRETGSAVTGADGRYQFSFGPGMWSDNEAMVQAATISVQLDGHFEKNLHRQGDLLAAMKLPADGNIGWGNKTADDVFMPGKTRTIDFVMLPATKVSGMVIHHGHDLEGVQVSLVGEDMPPSSSVVANTRTDGEGRFDLTEIPTGFKYQILVEPAEGKPPWKAWASPALVFVSSDDGDTHIQYAIDGKPVDFSCQQLTLLLQGNGTNWKSALKEAAERNLKLAWDGLSTDTIVRAGMAFLDLGIAARDGSKQ